MSRFTYFNGLGNSLIGASVLAFLLLQKHSGFVILFVWFFLVPWLLYSVWVIATRPAVRALQTKKVMIWFLLSVAVAAYHLQLHQKTRTNAQRPSTNPPNSPIPGLLRTRPLGRLAGLLTASQSVANAVIDYMKVNGTCPNQLKKLICPIKSFTNNLVMRDICAKVESRHFTMLQPMCHLKRITLILKKNIGYTVIELRFRSINVERDDDPREGNIYKESK